MARPLIALAALSVLGGLAAPNGATAAATAACRAETGAAAARVVELYTSEGCSTCPPADAWLATLRPEQGVIALGFHVDYWDRLGWPDRFATAVNTRRQHEFARRTGASNVYTPQVIVDGRDWRAWPALPPGQTASADPARELRPPIRLQREGDAVVAEVGALARPQRLAGYWAVVEDQHVSRVRAGENAGETLRHAHVVREWVALPAWDATQGLRARHPVSSGVPEHPRRVVLVITDAASQRPLQALALGC